jgi:hypothetical protein
MELNLALEQAREIARSNDFVKIQNMLLSTDFYMVQYILLEALYILSENKTDELVRANPHLKRVYNNILDSD